MVAGWRGAAACASLAWVFMRVSVDALCRTVVRLAATLIAKGLPPKLAARLSGAGAWVAAAVGKELSAIGSSVSALAEEFSVYAASRRPPEDEGEQGSEPEAA